MSLRSSVPEGLARRRRRSIPAAILAAGCLALAGCAQSSGAGPVDVVEQGYVSGDGSVRTWDGGHRPGPVAVVGTDFEGGAQDTTAWHGDVVVLNTWYAGCAPCRSEAPDLAALAADTADDGVHVLGINTTDEAGAAQAFQRTFQIPYPSIEDREGTAVAALSGTVPLQAVPSTVVLDRDGRVAARIIGMADASTLRALVDEVVAEGAGG